MQILRIFLFLFKGSSKVWFFYLAVLFRFYHLLVVVHHVFLSEQIKMMMMMMMMMIVQQITCFRPNIHARCYNVRTSSMPQRV